jgi:hypothetical protein
MAPLTDGAGRRNNQKKGLHRDFGELEAAGSKRASNSRAMVQKPWTSCTYDSP